MGFTTIRTDLKNTKIPQLLGNTSKSVNAFVVRHVGHLIDKDQTKYMPEDVIQYGSGSEEKTESPKKSENCLLSWDHLQTLLEGVLPISCISLSNTLKSCRLAKVLRHIFFPRPPPRCESLSSRRVGTDHWMRSFPVKFCVLGNPHLLSLDHTPHDRPRS